MAKFRYFFPDHLSTFSNWSQSTNFNTECPKKVNKFEEAWVGQEIR